MSDNTIGIIGAGKLGMTLAQLARKAGYRVSIAGSGDPNRIQLTVEALAPGAVAMTSREVAIQRPIVVLALPLSNFRELPKDQLVGKLVIDATNYWWEVDGPRQDILPDNQTTSEAVQDFLVGARVVKTFSHMGYHHLYDEAKPRGTPGRKAIAVAGNDQKDVETASRLVDDFGFDPVVIGSLEAGRMLEPGSKAFGANVDAKTLRRLVGL